MSKHTPGPWKAPDLLSLLKELEWSGVKRGPGNGPMFSGIGKPYPACPVCQGVKPMKDGPFIENANGHQEGCRLFAALEAML